MSTTLINGQEHNKSIECKVGGCGRFSILPRECLCHKGIVHSTNDNPIATDLIEGWCSDCGEQWSIGVL